MRLAIVLVVFLLAVVGSPVVAAEETATAAPAGDTNPASSAPATNLTSADPGGPCRPSCV